MTLVRQSIRIDIASSTITYLGRALIGVSEDDAVWSILRISVDGAITKHEYAGGTNAYNSIWTNRAALSYS